MKDIHSLCTFKQRKDTFLRRGRFRWPYIKYKSYLAQPDTLASAGFAFTPAKDAPDNVQCFVCGFELTGWEPTDDPFAEHYAHKPDCAYAQVHCRVRVARTGNKIEWVGWAVDVAAELTTEERARETNRMSEIRADVNSRLQTFAASKWPHMGRVGWNVTPDKLARAGFYFTPEWAGDDTATCAFCGYALAEWEPDDDPDAEHARRAPDCLFFRLAGSQDSVRSPEKPPVKSPVRTPVRLPAELADADSNTKRPSDQGLSDEMPNCADEQTSRRSSASSKRQRLSDSGDEPTNANNDDSNDAVPTNYADDNGPEASVDTHDTVAHDVNGNPQNDVVILSDAESNTGEERSAGATQVETAAQGRLSPIDMQVDLIYATNGFQTKGTQSSQTQVDEYNTAEDSKHIAEEGEAAAAVCHPSLDDGGEWDLGEDEEEMTVEEFIRACCDHKIASLETSAAQMVGAFMQRAESTRERICNTKW
ncbi:hypothetical protein IW140_000793 [Coemansia sp. RSA 1813]|nr:hypothetical protein EV178_000703 [Coemansia sp. RSA 1646]KAJ1773661.1 hypothetical protein LPJ74_000577 [Coemansia sp. RSA 1843]KAJ2092322.1 hypothetical protein IW138_001084 [Coemansia sp. RSA 986]KAJ2217449.1 hypothetical protein EV179_000599 [Coemansia sp. RSA 487]KAJ2572678.1 hypothetical protein IW140_000793 [Coemansia sp. RSA 1813]